MKYTILIIVSYYVGLSQEYIPLQGIPKDDSANTENVQSSTQSNIINSTESENLLNNDTSLNYLKNALEKDLYSVSQPKSSEINQRAFIYMNSVRPIHNKLYLSQIRNDPKNSSHTKHEDKLYEAFQEKLLLKQINKDCDHIKEDPNTQIQTNFESYIKKATEARLKDSSGKRDFLELLKMPLIRLVSKNNVEKDKYNKLKNTDTKEINIDKGLFEKRNESKNEDLISTEVERLADQFMSDSLERPMQTFPNSDKENIISNAQELHKSECKCEIGTSDSETSFYSIEDGV